ncbi:cytochrome P450 [Streptomyces venezuelae]
MRRGRAGRGRHRSPTRRGPRAVRRARGNRAPRSRRGGERRGGRHWDAPDVFRPERWAESGGHGPYVPFGMGPFSCAGAAVAHTLLTESLTALTDHAFVTVSGGDARAVMSGGNAPRPFAVHRTPDPRPPTRREGGDWSWPRRCDASSPTSRPGAGTGTERPGTSARAPSVSGPRPVAGVPDAVLPGGRGDDVARDRYFPS